jgi:hypothetical protein
MNMGPYHGDRDRYKATNHDHEDVMVGRMFYDASVPHTVVKDCRFHDIHAGANIRPLKTTSSASITRSRGNTRSIANVCRC